MIDIKQTTNEIEESARKHGWTVISKWLSKRESQYLIIVKIGRSALKVRISNHGSRDVKGEKMLRVNSVRGLRKALKVLSISPRPTHVTPRRLLQRLWR